MCVSKMFSLLAFLLSVYPFYTSKHKWCDIMELLLTKILYWIPGLLHDFSWMSVQCTLQWKLRDFSTIFFFRQNWPGWDVWFHRCLFYVNLLSHCDMCVMRLEGNKGGVAVSFMFNGTSFCFVCCHLTSGHEKMSRFIVTFVRSRDKILHWQPNIWTLNDEYSMCLIQGMIWADIPVLL